MSFELMELKTFGRVNKCLILYKRHIQSQACLGLKNRENRKNLTICVEGNISSGKTTFLEHFKNKFKEKIETFDEPVERWRDVHGYNMLDKFYEDPSRWSMAFESHVQLTWLEIHQKKTNKPIKLMERSLYSANYCFVENLFQSGVLHDLDYRILKDWFTWIINNLDCHVDLIVYLQTKPTTVFDRTLKRNWPEEKHITLDYLEKLHEKHEEWLLGKSKLSLPSKVLIIPAERNLEEMFQIYDRLKKEIFLRRI
uniref:Thymidine kinase 2, mitochondrial-like n=1 Tax=Crassostrea virginica TaxID=6565 RepID=A0A8B8B1N9_CRAVI|nr:thymidine kinase 2, mitochondrial-like [Crassostrea virginica]